MMIVTENGGEETLAETVSLHFDTLRFIDCFFHQLDSHPIIQSEDGLMKGRLSAFSSFEINYS
jgi:hypothetical protein